MKSRIYDKTQKGRDEIATRKFQLSPRLRSLLVLIDGKQNESSLLSKIIGLGLDQEHLQSLYDQEFIRLLSTEQPNNELEKNSIIDISLPFEMETETEVESEISHNINSAISFEENNVLEESHTVFQAPEQDDVADINTTSTELRIQLRIELLRKFLIESIDDYLGIKGFFILRKVRKAKDFDDFHAIRNPFILAILRKLGKDKALELRDEFDQMLYSRFSVDFPEYLDD